MRTLLIPFFLMVFAIQGMAQAQVSSAYLTMERTNGKICQVKAVVFAYNYFDLPQTFVTTLREKQSGNIVGNTILQLQSTSFDSTYGQRFRFGKVVYSATFQIPNYGVHYELMGTVCCLATNIFVNCPNARIGDSFLPTCDFIVPSSGTFKLPDFVLSPFFCQSGDSTSYASYNCMKGNIDDSLVYSLEAPQFSNVAFPPNNSIYSINQNIGMVKSKTYDRYCLGVKCSVFQNGIYSGSINNTVNLYPLGRVSLAQKWVNWINFLKAGYDGTKEFVLVKNVPFHLSMVGMNNANIFMNSQTAGELMQRSTGKPIVYTNTTFNAQYKYYNYNFDWTPTASDVRAESYLTSVRIYLIDTLQTPVTSNDLLLKLKVVATNAADNVDPYSEFLPVYPNPSAGALFVPFMLRKPSGVIVRFYDAVGRIAKSENLGNQPMGRNEIGMDVSDLTNGYYIMEVVTQSGELVNRQKVQVKQ